MLKRLLNSLRRWRGTPQNTGLTRWFTIRLKNSEEIEIQNDHDFETQKLAELWRNCGKQDYDKIIYGLYKSKNKGRGA